MNRRIRGPMPRVQWEGSIYSLTSRKTPIPDFSTMSRTEIHLWLIQNTRAKGYSKPNPLARLGGVVTVIS